MKKLMSIAFMMLCFVTFSYGQDNDDFGYWNDIQVSTPFNKRVDILGGIRFNTKRNGSRFAEQRIYTGLTLKSKDGRFVVSPWLIYLKNFGKVPYTEIRPQVTVGYRFNVGKTNITPRVRLEYHAKQRLKDDGRVIPILSIDRKVSKNYALFNTNEFWIPIANDTDPAKYRSRHFFGVTRTINKKLAVDIFYLLQLDQQVAPRYNHSVGATWKVRL